MGYIEELESEIDALSLRIEELETANAKLIRKRMEIQKRYIEGVKIKGDFWVIVDHDTEKRLSTVFDTKREAKRVLSDLEQGRWPWIFPEEEWI